MLYGTFYACPYGEPELHATSVQVELVRNAVLRVTVTAPAEHVNDYYGIYRNSQLVANIKGSGSVEIPREGRSNFIFALHQAQCADSANAFSYIVREFDTESSKVVTVRWYWPTEVMGAVGIDKLSNWAISGVYRASAPRVTNRDTWSAYDVELVVSGGTGTVTLYNGNTVVATGSATLGNTATLTGSISGTVTIAADAVSDTGTLYLRWPSKIEILRGTSNPPTTVVGTVNLNSADIGSFTEPSDLAAGTYYYRARQVSDTGVNGTESSTATAVINGAPEPPTDLHYVSGNASAPVIAWTPSTTVGATYNVYLLPDVVNPFATAGAGATGATLPAVSGDVQIMVRALNGLIEERNGNVLNLSFNGSGVFVPPSPNTPTIQQTAVAVSSGLNLSVGAQYPTAGELASPTDAQLFVRTASGAYGAAVATASWSAAGRSTRSAILSYTLPGSGLYYIKVRAVTAVGGYADSDEVLVHGSNAAPAALSIDTTVSRG